MLSSNCLLYLLLIKCYQKNSISILLTEKSKVGHSKSPKNRRGGFQIRYSDAYHDISNETSFDPVLYMLVLTERVIKISRRQTMLQNLLVFWVAPCVPFNHYFAKHHLGGAGKLETHDHVLIHQSGNEDALKAQI